MSSSVKLDSSSQLNASLQNQVLRSAEMDSDILKAESLSITDVSEEWWVQTCFCVKFYGCYHKFLQVTSKMT